MSNGLKQDLNEEAVRIENEVKKLPEKAQRAIYWVVENFNLVIEMCKESEMTEEEIEKYREIARKKEDYITLALLCVAKMYKNRGFETVKQ